MADQPAPSLDLDEVLARLQATVAERRRSGAYPAGLERDLEEHFRRIVAHRASPDFTDVRARLTALDERSRFGADRIHAQSRTPGGEVLHRAVSKAVARQTQGILDQVQLYADGVGDVLAGVVEALEDPEGHVHADLVGQLDAVLERLAASERRAVAAEAAVADLARRVEQLEAAAAPGP
ncbi:MAG: hypothetical protein ACT4PX_12125 [Actinomycetota bacterium]